MFVSIFTYTAFPCTSAPFNTTPNWPFPSCSPITTAVSGNIISFLSRNQSGSKLSSASARSTFVSTLFSSSVGLSFDLMKGRYFKDIQIKSKRAVTTIVTGTISGMLRL